MAVPYKCLFNHELLIVVTTQTPYQTYRENVGAAQVEGYIRELADTAVDAIMCCPTAWRLPLYPSRLEPHWTVVAPGQTEPLPEADWKYYEKVYWRARRMMLSGLDPVAISVRTAHETGKAIFCSYRMNDHHMTIFPDCPTHDRFWREHPEYRIGPLPARTNPAGHLNYLLPQVRARVAQVLGELIENYDFDGLELDFMRSPPYFPPDRTTEGQALMTEFVAELREMLRAAGRRRGRELALCVRLPRSLRLCAEYGLDPVEWNRRGLIDLANVSTFFINALNCEIEEFKAALPGCPVYGEMHFIYEAGSPLPGGFGNNILRKTPAELYYATALNFLTRGADGVSLFNFDYVRDHSFAEPRRKQFPGIEPHFAALRRIADPVWLRTQPKLYHWGNSWPPFPVALGPGERAGFDVLLGDELPGGFGRARLRLEGEGSLQGLQLGLKINGVAAEPNLDTGELVTPFSREALPEPERLQYFSLELGDLRQGLNEVELFNFEHEEYGRKTVRLKNLQLALLM